MYNRVRGLRTSGLLFLFWLVLALCGAVRYHYELTVLNSEQVNAFLSIVYVLWNNSRCQCFSNLTWIFTVFNAT
jgi:hypothetical protein